jgi:hypothetical protein
MPSGLSDGRSNLACFWGFVHPFLLFIFRDRWFFG